MVSIERQAEIDKMYDRIDILESKYRETGDESIRTEIIEILDQIAFEFFKDLAAKDSGD